MFRLLIMYFILTVRYTLTTRNMLINWDTEVAKGLTLSMVVCHVDIILL